MKYQDLLDKIEKRRQDTEKKIELIELKILDLQKEKVDIFTEKAEKDVLDTQEYLNAVALENEENIKRDKEERDRIIAENDNVAAIEQTSDPNKKKV